MEDRPMFPAKEITAREENKLTEQIENRAQRRAREAQERAAGIKPLPRKAERIEKQALTGTPVTDSRIEPRFVPRGGWQCGDAFKMYKYQDAKTLQVEWLWNSRDGVVPFIIRSKDGLELTHVDWHEDAYLPNFVPPVGMRIFTDQPGFDPAKHQHNVAVVTVDEKVHTAFAQLAAFHPYRPKVSTLVGFD